MNTAYDNDVDDDSWRWWEHNSLKTATATAAAATFIGIKSMNGWWLVDVHASEKAIMPRRKTFPCIGYSNSAIE